VLRGSHPQGEALAGVGDAVHSKIKVVLFPARDDILWLRKESGTGRNREMSVDPVIPRVGLLGTDVRQALLGVKMS